MTPPNPQKPLADVLRELARVRDKMTPGEWKAGVTQYSRRRLHFCAPISNEQKTIANTYDGPGERGKESNDALGIAALVNILTPSRLLALADAVEALRRLDDDDKLTCDNITYDIAAGNCPCSGCQATAALAKLQPTT